MQKWSPMSGALQKALVLGVLLVGGVYVGKNVKDWGSEPGTVTISVEELLRLQRAQAQVQAQPQIVSSLASTRRPAAVQEGESRFLIQPYLPSGPVSGPIRWAQLGESIRSEFTLGGQVSLMMNYFSKVQETHPPVWNNSLMTSLVRMAKAKNPQVGNRLSHYGPTANDAFFKALKDYPVEGKTVLVVGSQHPWVEAICLGHKAEMVTTVDFNVPIVDYPKLSVLSLAQLDATKERYDAIFSFSSLEHDGLGRYGDPLHPNGDLERMRKIRGLIKDDGLLYLGVPNGNDTLVFNAHRVYGPIRFPLLTRGWNLLATYGLSLEEAYRSRRGFFHQPLHVLSPGKL